MPTYSAEERFLREFRALTREQALAFLRAKDRFAASLAAGTPPPRGLRIRQLAAAPGVYELTWAPDGRATFTYDRDVRPGQLHVHWRRIGGHAIFNDP